MEIGFVAQPGLQNVFYLICSGFTVHADHAAKHPASILLERTRTHSSLVLLRNTKILQRVTPSASFVKEGSISCFAAARVPQSSLVTLLGSMDRLLRRSRGIVACGETPWTLLRVGNHLCSLLCVPALDLFFSKSP